MLQAKVEIEITLVELKARYGENRQKANITIELPTVYFKTAIHSQIKILVDHYFLDKMVFICICQAKNHVEML